MELLLLLAFLLLHPLMAIGIRRSSDLEGYVVSGRDSRAGVVALSLLATMLGASAVVGTASLAYEHGWIAYLWLGAGVLGLLALAALVHRVPFEEALSLPDMLGRSGGSTVRWVSALVILPAWVGIISAQIAAAGKLGTIFVADGFVLVASATAAVVVAYVASAGQRGVMRTDRVQVFVLTFLLGALLWAMIGDGGSWDPPLTPFKPVGASMLLDIVLGAGFAYFIGPDIYSRLLTLPDAGARSRALVLSAGGLAILALLITAVGVFGASVVQLKDGDSLLVAAPSELWGIWGGRVVALGVLAAILSSADTCLLSAATILSVDVLNRRDTRFVRISAVGLGIVALLGALWFNDVIAALLFSYTVYTCGLAIPMVFALFLRSPLPPWTLRATLLVGAGYGTAGKLLEWSFVVPTAVCLSLLFALAGRTLEANNKR